MNRKGINWKSYKSPSSNNNNDDELSYLDIERSSNTMTAAMMQDIQFTPFGDFHKDDPANPFNLYDEFYWGYLIGLSVNDPRFLVYDTITRGWEFTLDFIQGIAVWKVVDPHRIIVVPAKYYCWETVRKEIESRLIDEISIKENKLIEECHKLSHQLQDQHVVIVMPNGKLSSSEKSDANHDKFKEDALEIFQNHLDSYLIINGVPAERIQR